MYIKSRVVLALGLIAGALGALPGVTWNTFMGGTGFDESGAVAVDAAGNIYVAGYSQFSWGTPLNSHAGEYDAYVAKFNSNGVREWHTFIGGTAWDFGQDIALDINGNIYVTGTSTGSWGTPVRSFTGSENVFVAKLNNNGALQWNTFLGGGGLNNQGYGVALDSSGNIYVTGTSGAWGTPLNPHGGASKDAFVAKINNSGVLQWHTFLGGDDLDDGFGIDVTPSGDIFIAGESVSNWGTPVNAHHGCCYSDAFVAKLNANGALQWNTFLGGDNGDRGAGIAVDGNNKVYITGFTWLKEWGTPITPYGGGIADAFVARLDGNGNFQWNTFLGGTEDVSGRDITMDNSGNIFVTGYSGSTWGTPVNAFAGYYDAFVAKFNANGVRLANTFLGGYGSDEGYAIAVDNGIIYATGDSSTNWGNPLVAYTNGADTFVAEVVFDAPIFNDVATSYWANQYVERLYNEGVTGGCTTSPLNYCPENQVTRAQMAVFLLKGIHTSTYAPPAVGSSTGFGDVPDGYWASAWIKQLAVEGITGGCAAGLYCPENPVTRAQMAVFLLKAKYGSSYNPPPVGTSTGFGDVPTDHWASAWIKQLAAESITGGCGGGNYCPESPVTRAQMAVFLVKTFNLP